MNPVLLGLLLVGVVVVLLPFVLRGWRRRQARRAWLALTPRLDAQELRRVVRVGDAGTGA